MLTSVQFGGIASSHMSLVVRRSPGASPSNARVAVEEIAKLEITTLDTRPTAAIKVGDYDPVVERELMASSSGNGARERAARQAALHLTP